MPWGYVVNSSDSKDRSVKVRAIFSSDHINTAHAIRDILKDKIDAPLGRWNASDYLSFHLLSSIYDEGIHLHKPVWCLYPSHDGAQIGVLDIFARYASRMFRENFYSDLLLRGQAVDSRHRTRREAKKYGGISEPSIEDQFRSIHINPKYANSIKGKSVIVLDDFITTGGSFEAARNYLYEAEAIDVHCIAVGKFPTPHKSYSISREIDPFVLNEDISSQDLVINQCEKWSNYDSRLNIFLMNQIRLLLGYK